MMKEEKINTGGTVIDACCCKDMHDRPNICNMLAVRGRLSTTVYICGQAVFEAFGLGVDVGAVRSKIEATGATVVMMHVTPEMVAEAKVLERRHEELHPGDSLMLVCAKFVNRIMTSDKALGRVAELEGVEVVDPRGELGNGGRFKSRFDCNIRFYRRRPSDGCSPCRVRTHGPGSGAAPKRRRKHRRRAKPQP